MNSLHVLFFFVAIFSEQIFSSLGQLSGYQVNLAQLSGYKVYLGQLSGYQVYLAQL